MDNANDLKLKDSEKTNTGKPDLVSFVLLKGEKIVAAVYAITAFLSDSEPLKWKLREASLSLLSELSLLRRGSANYRNPLLDRIGDYLESFIIMIDVGLAAGFVSEMNFRILRNECVNLLAKIKELSADSSLETSLRVEMPLLIAAAPTETERTNHLSFNIQNQDIKDRKLFNSQIRNTEQGPVDNFVKTTMHNNVRRDAILKFVRGKGWTAIKDIAAAVPGCSVKTVQRELVNLVNDGFLKKQGDRRWSRYLLA